MLKSLLVDSSKLIFGSKPEGASRLCLRMSADKEALALDTQQPLHYNPYSKHVVSTRYRLSGRLIASSHII